ncbi:MAG: ABC transporter permease, partial [Eubacterium sp.]|nr:ABC transporter permease [Eubacterium sp.]
DTLNEKRIPAAFVCAGTETDAGGKESLAAYLTLADFDYPKYIKIDEYTIPNNKNTVFQQEYLNEKYNVSNDEFYVIETDYTHYSYSYNQIETGVHYMGIIGMVLALTSCIAIVNSFNSNIKERKQQIGMLRAVGTTKKQIVKILGREAFIISLISIPVSLGISYLLVLALSLFYGKDFVLTIDVIAVVVCGVVGLITVMLAALIPIIHATRITPMQAIRSVEVARKMKIKKIKTQKSFSVPKLLAKRSMAFHKGNQIAVSVLLVSTILFSCYGFSLISYEKTHMYESGYDYYINGWASGEVYIDGWTNRGITDIDKQNICAVPYVTGYGVKNCEINVMIDEFTDYFKIVSGESVYVDYTGFDKYGVTAENYAEMNKTEFREDYSDIKSQAGYNRDYIPTTLTAIDDWKLETLKDYLVSGEINLDKLASGEEVILIAPQKAAVGLIDYYTQQEIVLLDEKIEDGFEPALYGEYEYKAGDMIDLSMIHYNDAETIYAENETIYNIDRVDKKAKIGAVISPNAFKTKENQRILQYDSDYLSVLTSIAGMNQFSNNLNYECIYMYANGEITDEIDEAVISTINPMLYKYDTEGDSIYQYEKRSNESNNSDLVVMLALMIIGFAICASLTNNAFTASIRERKRELGTLRAVGISRREFVESYVRQLLKTFGLGYGLGFGIFTLGYLICQLVVYIKNLKPENRLYPSEVVIDFNPWVTIAFCIILFAICSIHLWVKIRKEMKNSII